jgi:small-conductance mechanosensitive channel
MNTSTLIALYSRYTESAYSLTVNWLLLSILIYIVILFGQKIAQNIVLKKLKFQENTILKITSEFLFNKNKLFYFVTSLFLATFALPINDNLENIINTIFILFFVKEIVSFTNKIAVYYFNIVQKNNPDTNKSLVNILEIGTKIIVWALGLLFILSNWGLNITSLIAGLGIGGIAIALAVQSILGDLFNSLTIFFDKPFEVGDIIEFEGKIGTVEKIGIKSTRIKALKGEQIVIPNSNLTSSNINNFKRLKERRVEIHIGVDYKTTQEQLEKTPKILEECCNASSDVKFNSATLYQLSDSSIDFKLIYYVQSDQYLTYLETRQNILLNLVKALKENDINIPFPTRTIISG